MATESRKTDFHIKTGLPGTFTFISLKMKHQITSNPVDPGRIILSARFRLINTFPVRAA